MCIRDSINIYENSGLSVVGVNKVLKEDISKYGVINPSVEEDKNIYVNDIVEKPTIENAPSDLAVVGRYILDSSIFGYLKRVSEDKSNEIQLTDAIKLMLEEKKVLACKYLGKKFDCGSKVGYVEATLFKALKDESMKDMLKKYL